MTDTTIRKRPTHVDPAGEPIRAPAWRNLYFLKDGRSFHGGFEYPTEKQAREAASESVASDQEQGKRFMRASGRRLKILIRQPPIEFFYDEMSHTIQIPVRAP
jgi:hypothetical protein